MAISSENAPVTADRIVFPRKVAGDAEALAPTAFFQGAPVAKGPLHGHFAAYTNSIAEARRRANRAATFPAPLLTSWATTPPRSNKGGCSQAVLATCHSFVVAV
jgi:hypothetical protein